MSLKAQEIIEQYTQGYALLEQKLWDLENKASIEADIELEENFPEPYQDFQYRLATKNIKEHDQTGLLNNVELVVNWQGRNEKRQISVVTYLINKKNE